MRILLVADIHANWPALQAVADEPHDVCLCLGDLVDYGLEPAPCIDWVREQCQAGGARQPRPRRRPERASSTASGFKYLTGVTRPLTRERLRPGRPALSWPAAGHASR